MRDKLTFVLFALWTILVVGTTFLYCFVTSRRKDSAERSASPIHQETGQLGIWQPIFTRLAVYDGFLVHNSLGRLRVIPWDAVIQLNAKRFLWANRLTIYFHTSEEDKPLDHVTFVSYDGTQMRCAIEAQLENHRPDTSSDGAA